jgi:hypothetical protein
MSYRRELEKYRDLDEDEILGALTEEELRTLENELDELDPDVSSSEGEHVLIDQRQHRGHLWYTLQVCTSSSCHCHFPYMVTTLEWCCLGSVF